MSTNNDTLVEQAKAKELITNSARNYLTAKLRLPLGNPALKQVHTNQFLFTDLPKRFALENWETIGNALNSGDTRFADYTVNRWYIEGITIDVDMKNNKAEMSIDVNAFATSTGSYAEGRKSFEKAYQDAVSNNTKNTTSTSAKTTSSTKASTNAVAKNNTTLKGGEGKYIDDLVKKVVGNETDALKKAKLIHEHLRSKQKYSYYECTKYKTPETCYKNIKHINCADMARLTASMMRSAGISCYVVHSTCHFYVVLKIGGKLYCSDNASTASNGRAFNYYWKGSSCKSGSTVKFTGKGCYYANCGKVPSC